MIRRSRLAGGRALALAVVAVLALSACTDDADPGSGPAAEGDSSPSATESAYLPVPAGVELTAQGSELELGDLATVAYEPRKDTVAALDLTVTKLEKASFKMFVGWKLSDETLTTTPYFVHAKVENIGKSDLGGQAVPLYALSADNKLIEASTFQSTFKPCPSTPLPKKFKNGDSVKTCLVYLAPDKGKVTGVSFRPTETFNPIVWTGEVTRPAALEKDDKKDDTGKGEKDKFGNGGN